jgi:uncharacterized repeat protein (TIGR01451 family)
MAMAVAAIALSGCGVDKADEHARQLDVVGDVQIATTFCTSGDGDRDAHACATYDRSHRAQALVAYRIPVGSEAPETLSDDQGTLHFARSDTYAAYMQDTYPEAGMHWVGYVSDPQAVAAGTQGAFTVSPRLTLPGAGEPFTGPYRYYVEGGYRELNDPTDDGTAVVDCDDGPTSCLASGSPSGEDSLEPTRDLGVLPGGGEPTAEPGGHLSVPFNLRFAGAGLDGAQFDLVASSDLDGAQLGLSQDTLEPEADSEKSVAVDVAVPADAREGTYEVKLTAGATGDSDVIVRRAMPTGAQAAGTEQRDGTMTFRVVAPPLAHEEPPAPAAPPAPAEPDVPAQPAQPAGVPPEQSVHQFQPRARLALSLTAIPHRAYTGDFASYLVVVRNASDEPAMRTRVCQALPGRVQFVQASRRVAFRGRRACFGRGRLSAGRSMVAVVYVHVDTDARAGMARASASAAAANADRVGARTRLRILRRAVAPRRAPVTG